MLVYYTLAGIGIVALLVVIGVVVRKFRTLATINVDSIAEEKEERVKNRILVERLARKSADLLKVANTITKPLQYRIGASASNFYKKVMDLEQKIVHARQPLKAVDVKQQVNDLLVEAEQSESAENFETAEEKYIAILESDPKHVGAYEGLIKVYIEMRDYRKARETARYLIKLLTKKKTESYTSEEKHDLAGAYEDLSYVYELEKKYASAAINYKKAVELEPNNPRFLDSLVKISILVKDKKAAAEAFLALKQADPDNQKLDELEETIEQLPDQVPPSDAAPTA